MARLILGPILRRVDETSATVWVETDSATTAEVLGATAPTFSVGGHHYALVMVDGLEPGRSYEYTVTLDGETVWPEPTSTLPTSRIRTRRRDDPVSVVVGSCRAAAPHEPPFTLESTFDHEGRGIDALWAHARRVADEDPSTWPDLLLFVGDQVYADDSSPKAKERLDARRNDGLPPEIVADFEEYTWLYHESWSLPMERWLLSTVPSAMIFDDHDMVDDWNISESWVVEHQGEQWWHEHHVGGLMSYWIYQHLGNLSPTEIREQGMLAELERTDDGTAILRSWAEGLDEARPTVDSGGHSGTDYRFSHARRVGVVTLVVVDSRFARQLSGERRMVKPTEWEWVRAQTCGTVGHLLIATSMPVFIAPGLHDLQGWSERLCDGVWGRRVSAWGERLRRSLDLEDWSAFTRSYEDFVTLMRDILDADVVPETVVVAAGDIHFSYAARVDLEGCPRPVWQVVSSPIRNALIPPERGVMRFALTRAGRSLGAALRRFIGLPDTRPDLDVVAGPLFANNICMLTYGPTDVALAIEHYTPDDDGEPALVEFPHIGLG